MTSGVSFTGNWGSVSKVVKSLNANMNTARRMSLQHWALYAESTAKGHISFQDLPWAELSPDWLEHKVRHGLSEDIYVATSSYFQSITSYVDMKTFTAFAGVKRGVYEADGTEIVNIAELLEFGFLEYPFLVGGLPARPLWQPTFEETLLWWKENATPEELFARIMINRANGLWQAKPFGR